MILIFCFDFTAARARKRRSAVSLLTNENRVTKLEAEVDERRQKRSSDQNPDLLSLLQMELGQVTEEGAPAETRSAEDDKAAMLPAEDVFVSVQITIVK